jgi:hypothetical protein
LCFVFLPLDDVTQLSERTEFKQAMWKIVVLVIFLNCACFSGANQESIDSPVVELFVDKPLESQEIPYGEKRVYWLQNLATNSFYEVRISYPATVHRPKWS